MIERDAFNGVQGEGPLAYTWRDKPHRIVYDLCAEVRALRGPTEDEALALLASTSPDLMADLVRLFDEYGQAGVTKVVQAMERTKVVQP